MKIETKVDTKWVSKPRVVKKPLNKKLQKQRTLTDAIHYNKYELVELLLKQGYAMKSFPNNMENLHSNFVPFMFFCDSLDAVTLAIESYGADVNIVWEGHTSLYYRRINIAEYDIRRGNDILNNKMLVATYMESKGAISK